MDEKERGLFVTNKQCEAKSDCTSTGFLSSSLRSVLSLKRCAPKRPAPKPPAKATELSESGSIESEVSIGETIMPVSRNESNIGPNGWTSSVEDKTQEQNGESRVVVHDSQILRATSMGYVPQGPQPIYQTVHALPHSSNYGSFFLTSIPGSDQKKLVPVSHMGNGQSLEYVPVAPLAYVPQSPNAIMESSQTGDMRTFSEPVIYTRNLSLPTQPSLDRLSEKDENEDYYEDVFTDSKPKENTPKPEKRRAKVERSDSDSVSLPHMNEELVLSRRLNLKVTFTNLTLVVLGFAVLVPNSAAIVFSFFRLVFGTLFPAYYSYKAVRTKNVKEYVKWMMYWIVFAFFTCAETITDVFVSFWFPFYYEIKILVVLWLLSPATKGSSILYRKFVHPWLTEKEGEIDEYIARAKEQGYSAVVQLGSKGVHYATNVIMQTAIKGGGGIVGQIKRSYSTSEIGHDESDFNRNNRMLPYKQQKERDPTWEPHSDDDNPDISDSFSNEPRLRAQSESSVKRATRVSASRGPRAVKTQSVDVSDMKFLDSSDSMSSAAARRRSPRGHDLGRMSESTSQINISSRRPRPINESPYATLPRPGTRKPTKKRQI